MNRSKAQVSWAARNPAERAAIIAKGQPNHGTAPRRDCRLADQGVRSTRLKAELDGNGLFHHRPSCIVSSPLEEKILPIDDMYGEPGV